MSSEILTLRDVSRFLKVSEKTVYRLAQSGKIPSFKAGGSWRFRRSDIEAWVEERIHASASGKENGSSQA